MSLTAKVLKPGTDSIRIAMFKNGHLRLLMTLVGFERLGNDDDPQAPWIIPSTLTADELKQSSDLIKQSEFSPPVFDDGQEAGDFIRRKSAGKATTRSRQAFDDEDDTIDNEDEDEELLFPAGGPTPMNKSDALAALKKTRRKRRREGSEEGESNGLTDEQLEARAAARRAKELEKNRKIKSELFVTNSDEEDDEERDRVFFEAEEKLRQRSKITIMKELLGVGSTDKVKQPELKRSKKRQSSAVSLDSDDEDVQTSSRNRQSSAMLISSDEAPDSGASSPAERDDPLVDSNDEATDTPMSSPHLKVLQAKRRKVSSDEKESTSPPTLKSEKMITDSDDEEDMPITRPVRQRVRAGFIMDSSDEE